jgi:mRNA-degrading endonuclease RelE of RelBE toxin-antitoxin system
MSQPSHATAPRFWRGYDDLPWKIRQQADKQFALLKDNPRHPSVQFRKLGEKGGLELWSARVTDNYRALAIKRPGISSGFGWAIIRPTMS